MSKQPLLSVSEARQRILAAVAPVTGTQLLPLEQALHRILRSDIHAPHDLPPHRNSAMDGYAINADDLPASGQSELLCVGRSFAGAPFDGRLESGQCIRIMTGAVVPEGADSVIMQEQVQRLGERVQIGPNHRRGDNVRHPGEDLRAGSLVLQSGQRLGNIEIALLASLGIAQVTVQRRLRVAICSTGDELRRPGEPLAPGDIYDSNRALLAATLNHPAIELYDLGILGDDRETLRATFQEVTHFADLLITSGGVSVGEADFVKEILTEIGEVDFWRINIKPGKPLAFGKIGPTHFFGLPGNPVSALITFQQFVQPALERMSGSEPRTPLRFNVPLRGDLHKQPGRETYLRGILRSDPDGTLEVSSAGHQGSHVLSSALLANCLIILPADSSGAASGEPVLVEPLRERMS